MTYARFFILSESINLRYILSKHKCNLAAAFARGLAPAKFSLSAICSLLTNDTAYPIWNTCAVL